jgi:hypothetical protein
MSGGGGMWTQSEVLPIRLRYLKTAADETGSVPMEKT